MRTLFFLLLSMTFLGNNCWAMNNSRWAMNHQSKQKTYLEELDDEILKAAELDDPVTEIQSLVMRRIEGNICPATNQQSEITTDQESLNNKLIKAARNGSYNEVQSLIALGANVNGQCCTDTPLHAAVGNHRLGIALLLLQSGANVYAGRKFNKTPLFACNDCHCPLIEEWQVVTNRSEAVRLALCTGQHVRTGVQSNLRILPTFIIQQICSYLRPRDLAQDPAIMLECKEQCTKNTNFLTSVKNGNITKVKELLAHGADINIQDGFGRNALFIVLHANGDWKKVLLFLLESRINYKGTDCNGNYLIQAACQTRNGYGSAIISAWPRLVETSASMRLSFCLAMHERVGSSSPAHILVREIFREICSYLTPRALLLEVNQDNGWHRRITTEYSDDDSEPQDL